MLPNRLCVCLLCVCLSAFEASGAQEDSLPNDTNIILELLPDVGRPGEQSFIAISLVTSEDIGERLWLWCPFRKNPSYMTDEALTHFNFFLSRDDIAKQIVRLPPVRLPLRI